MLIYIYTFMIYFNIYMYKSERKELKTSCIFGAPHTPRLLRPLYVCVHVYAHVYIYIYM